LTSLSFIVGDASRYLKLDNADACRAPASSDWSFAAIN
jgi:hypothetical protein